ncbi:hypothetical protein Leryth_011994 [Lithospermum erythrorhizon]|uniref:Uncharacterized protein n=1 Tax=Lithospermum erythrorhizon TaxID=34254 RepID=A0AAV3P6B5_LITER|nr:hypothetical protein Leryth_011994 [Lithospermum erythrorhizon]
MRCIKSPCPFSPYKLSSMEIVHSFNDRTVTLLRPSNPMPMAVKSGKVFVSQYGVSSTLPPASPDLNVLLPTSAALLLLYWITNFVLPDILYKNLLQSEHAKKEDNEK